MRWRSPPSFAARWTDEKMTRSSLVVRGALAVAGAAVLVGGGLVVRAWRKPLAAPPVVVTAAYQEYADTLRRDETLGDLLQRAGITGRAYGALLTAAHV